MRNAVILALFASLLLSTACGNRNNANTATNLAAKSPNDNSNAARTNSEELGLVINLPYDPEEVFWKEPPAAKRLIAVLKFSKADSDKLAADAVRGGTPQPITLQCENWFPAELIALSEMSGDADLKGTAYSANAFFQAPYNAGRITRIENTDYFVLDLSAA